MAAVACIEWPSSIRSRRRPAVTSIAWPPAFVADPRHATDRRLCLHLLGSPETTNQLPAPHALRRGTTVQTPGNKAKPVEPVLMRSRARQADRPADRLPALAAGPPPYDLRIERRQPQQPWQGGVHAGDGGCRGRRQPVWSKYWPDQRTITPPHDDSKGFRLYWRRRSLVRASRNHSRG